MNTFKLKLIAVLMFLFLVSFVTQNQSTHDSKDEINKAGSPSEELEIAYVYSLDSQQLTPIELTTGNSGRPIHLEVNPEAIVISPTGNTAYLLLKDSKEIHVINLLKEESLQPIVLDEIPLDMAISKDGKSAYIIFQESNEVSVVALGKNHVSLFAILEELPLKIAISEEDQSVLISYPENQSVTKIDIHSKNQSNEILEDKSKNLVYEKDLHRAYLTPNGKKAYTTQIGGGVISKYELQNQEFKESHTIKVDQKIDAFALFPKKELVAHFEVHIANSGEPTEFDASQTIALQNTHVEYSWEFGDGESLSTNQQKISHTYQSNGTYTVRLVATESLNSLARDIPPLVSTYEQEIVVIDPLPTKSFGVGRGGGTVAPTVTVSSDINPSIFGQTVTFSINVSGTGPIPTGSVTLINGATQIGTAILDGSGNASIPISTLSVGSHTITASYEGDSFYGTGVSIALSQSVNQASSTTTIASNTNPSEYGNTIVFTASVTTGLSTQPTGTVTFYDGATQIGSGTLNSSGTTTFSTNLLSVGSHAITANYNGDVNFTSSTSSSLTQAVNAADTTTSISCSVNPAVFGQSVTFTAVVSSSITDTPTGTVIFTDGSTQIGTGTLDGTGTATFTTNLLSAGVHSITANYQGDPLFLPSSSTPLNLTVNKAITSTSLSSTPNSSFFGQSVTITAVVSITAPGSGTLTGTVEFFDGLTSIGTANISSGVATLSSSALAVGTHSITAVYSGSSDFLPSTSPPWSQAVNQAVTSTAISSSANPAPFGQSITFTATISVTSGSGTPTGTVSFFDGAILLGNGTISSGQATFTTSSLSVGSHPITATYNGSSSFAGSTSTILTQVINKGATSTSVSSTSNPSTYGQAITLTGTVAVTSGAGTPTGSIQFFDGSTSLGTATISGTTATLSLFNLTIGAHSITAVYSGDNNFLTSTSSNLNQVVNQATPIITLIPSANPSNFGDSVTFTSTVSAPTSLGIPTGTVTFFDGATSLGTGTLSSSGANISTATFATADLFGGSHSITAVYSGDTNFKTVTSTTLTQVVNQAVSTSTIIFSSSPNPTQFGQVVSLRATVTGSVANPPQAPLGSVVFMDGATTLGAVPLSQILANTSSATLNISTLVTGSHSITASYLGDVNYPSSNSTAMTQNVIKTGSATVITSSVTPSVFGQNITITATVTNNVSGTGNPTGTVQFYDSATLLGSGTLSPSGPNSSVATFSTSSLSLGSHTLIGFFNGDSNFTSSSSAPITQVVVQDASSVVVTSSLNPSTFGSSVTFTATVSANAPGSGTPTGTVNFFEGSTLLGTATLSSGSGSFSTIALYPGTHPITAVYSGDTNFIAATSPALNQVVTNQLNTVTTITSARNSSPTTSPVTFSATVTAITGSPTGTVTFSDGGVPFGTGTIVNGVASFTEPGSGLTTIGVHSITATYNGDANFITSTSAPFSQYVVPLDTTTFLTVAPNHSEQANAVLTAQVSVVGGSGPLTGSVTFYQGSMLLPGTVNFNPTTGVATLTPNNLHFGSSPITAIYSGDQTTFAESFSNAVILQVQQTDMLTTSTVLTTSLSSAYNCQNINLTATVTATQGFYTPSGVVTFLDGGIEIGSALLNSSGVAVLPISTLAVGSHTIQATYNSDSNYAFSISNTVPVTVMTNTTTTTFTLIPLLTNTPYGQDLIFAARATSLFSTPTGTITFSIPSGALATVPLDSTGQATLQTTGLPIGTNVITATYNGTGCFTTSSANVTHTVDLANPVVNLSSTPNSSVYGNTVTIKAVLSSNTTSIIPTGTVTFFNGTTNLGTVTVIQGEASISVPGLPAGFQILKASYSGDSNFNAINFPSIIQTVSKAATTVALVSFSPNPAEYGELVTYRATVSSLANTPTGTVTFMNGSTVLGTSTLIGASATLQTQNLNLGSNSITAVYNGDSNFNVATSNAFSQTITQSASITSITSTSPNPSTFGGLVTVNVAVNAINPGSGIPTGTITGTLGSTTLGTATLTNGTASFSTSALPAGVNSIKVTYSGDANFTASNALTTQTVNQASTTTTLTSTNNPSVSGQSVTLSAVVASTQGTPTGTVSFFNGTTPLAVQAINASGMASITLSNLATGTQSIRAVYNGSTNLATSTSSTLSQVVNKAATTTLVSSLDNPSFYGENVVIQAHVNATSPGTGTPTGTVTFLNGVTVIGAGTLDNLGNASISTSALAASGTAYSITASYGGNSSFNSSTSSTLNQNVHKSATQTRVTYTPNPAALGGSVTFNVVVAPINTGAGIPTGSVTILNGSTVIGSGTLNASGQVSIVSSTLPAGALALVASYSGDSNFEVSSSAITQSVTQTIPTISLVSSANPSVVGQPVTFTTTITSTSGIPTGTVAFFDGSNNLGTQTLNSSGVASMTVPNLLLGNHSVTAVYSGDVNNDSVTSTVLSHLVNQAATVTNVASIPNPTFYGETVTLYASVIAVSPATNNPTGTVTFKNGSTEIGTIPLNAGSSLLTISDLPPGNNSITATYNGSTSYASSLSSAITQVVNPTVTTINVALTPNPSSLGGAVTANVTVAAVNGFYIPTGTVSASYGSTLIGSGILNGSGQATFSLTNLPAGVLGIEFKYSGDSNNLSSTTTYSQTVTKSSAAISLTSSVNPSVFGQPVTLSTTLTSASGTPSGTVGFYDGTTCLATETLNSSGSASFTTSTLTLGSHSITVIYSGDAKNLAITSAPISQLVNQASTTTTITLLPNPVFFGETVEFYANVNAVSPSVGIPTGSVTFKNGSTVLGTSSLNGGVAMLALTNLPTGSNSITASYNASANFAASISSSSTLTINPTATTIRASSSPNPSSLGNSVTANITVAAVNGFSVPTGTVTAFYGSTQVGSGTLNGSGQVALTLNNLPAGVLNLVINYSGDANNLASSTSITQTVNKSTASVGLTSSNNPSFVGQSVTFTANVTSPTNAPTGTVLLLDGNTTIGTQSVNTSGVATFQITDLTLGTHAISAVYNGDANNSTANSSVINQVVSQGSTSVNLISVLNPSPYGESIALTANVNQLGFGASIPTGTVTFKDGSNVLGTVSLDSSGQAHFATTSLPSGAHALTAVYNGDTNFSGATSSSVTGTVFKTTTALNILSSTPNPSSFGNTVTANVSVVPVNTSSGVPTGTVNAYYGSQLVGSGTLNGSGQASLSLTNLPSGTLGIELTYVGDVNFLTTSNTLTQTVNSTTSTTTVTSTFNPSTFDQTVTLNATVVTSSGVPTGNVTFFDGTVNLGSSLINGSGVASISVSTLGIGSHSIRAVYSGSTNITGSTSSILTQVVNPASTTTTLNAVANPAVFGSTVNLTATVVSGSAIPNGTVTFFDGSTNLGTEILDDTGTARFLTSVLSAGTHSLTAVFNGNAEFLTSTSPLVNEVINKAPTTTTITSSNPNPSVFGEVVSFYVNVSSTTNISRSGTVSFFDGSTLLGSSPVLTGLAIFSTANLSVGNHTIEAVYNGDSNFATSTSSPPLVQTVNQINITVTTVTSLTSNLNPSNYGDPVTFDVSITPIAGGGTPTGVVTIYSGANPLVTLPLVNGAASYTISTLPAGTNQIVALYSGDSNFSASTRTLAQDVDAIPSTTTIVSNLNPSNYGDAVTFTANVSSSTPGTTPTGTVTFFDGMSALQTFTLNASGNASYTVSSLSPGTHSIKAVYNPDSNFTTSNASVDQVVNVGTTTTSIISGSPNPSAIGAAVTFIATTNADAGIPTGTITFYDGISSLGTVSLVGNIASIMVSNLSAGSHSITAVYNGNANFAPSLSTPFNQVVDAAVPSTTTTLISSPNPAVVGSSVIFNVEVASSGGIPGGTVTLYDNNSSLVTVVLDTNGNASYATSSLAIGTHPIQAVYNGSSTFSSSNSSVINQMIVASALPNTPTNFVGTQQENRYFNRTQWVNILRWNAPLDGPAPTSYRIYRNAGLTQLVAEIPATDCLTYEDSLKKKNKTRTYYLVAVNQAGFSSAISVTVNQCQRIK